MSREYGLFVIKHSIFAELPIELIKIITGNFYHNLLEYMISVYKFNWINLRSHLSDQFIYENATEDIAKIINGNIWNHFDMRLIEKYPNIVWNWNDISRCCNIVPVFDKYLDKWNWHNISFNKFIPMKLLLQYSNKLNWSNICRCRNVKVNPDVSLNSSITFEYVTAHDFDWEWKYLSLKIHIDHISTNPDKPWDWGYICNNPTISEQFIENNLEKINWHELCLDNISIEFVIKHKNRDWDWNEVSFLPVTMDIVLNNIDIPWNFETLTANDGITSQNILDYPAFEWNWDYFADKYMIENIDKLFRKESKEMIKRKLHHYLLSDISFMDKIKILEFIFFI